ncbi:MAG: type II toxin-antitoxin system RelE family toxin [Thermoplasmatota archaeon]
MDERLKKDLDNIPDKIVEHLLEVLDEFEEYPFRPRPRFDVKPLKGFPGNTYRLRIRDYRVLYSIDKKNKEVKITTIAHRSDVYK